MILELIFLLIGLALVVVGAGFLVEGAAALGKRLGISPLILGLSITAFGTSLPELFINIVGAFEGSAIGIGDAIGASIANMGLVIGAVALIRPVFVKNTIIKKHLPILLLAVLVLLLLGADGLFQRDLVVDNFWSRQDGLILLFVFAIFVSYIFERASRRRHLIPEEQVEHFEQVGRRPLNLRLLDHKMWRLWISIAGGIIGLLAGSQLIIASGGELALDLGVSQEFIGLALVALGTTLPEFATSLIAVRKYQPDIAVGNAVGSAVFNLLFIIGFVALIKPVVISISIFASLWAALIFAIAFRAAAISDHHKIKRWQGLLLMLLYIGYIIYITIQG
jgi:cation:H+ antiporter